MNSAVTRYKRALKKKLPCCGDMRRSLLNRFQAMLDAFVEDHAAPTVEDLLIAFGTPEAMAEVLSEGVSEEETKRHKNVKLLQKICSAIFVVIFVLFSIYVFFLKEMPMTSVDEFYPSSTEASTYIPD